MGKRKLCSIQCLKVKFFYQPDTTFPLYYRYNWNGFLRVIKNLLKSLSNNLNLLCSLFEPDSTKFAYFFWTLCVNSTSWPRANVNRIKVVWELEGGQESVATKRRLPQGTPRFISTHISGSLGTQPLSFPQCFSSVNCASLQILLSVHENGTHTIHRYIFNLIKSNLFLPRLEGAAALKSCKYKFLKATYAGISSDHHHSTHTAALLPITLCYLLPA